MENHPNDDNNPGGTRKRKTKSELGEGTHECDLCKKKYYSYSALYTHCWNNHKIKIKKDNPKGRPKKKEEKIKYDPMNPSFFRHEERTGKTEKEKINECAERAFEFIYDINREKAIERKMKIYYNINEHPFLYKFINDMHNTDIILNKKTNTDNVLMNYLNQISDICNENYFQKLIVFVTLFREFVNIFTNQEYTEIKEAEDVPDMSNNFINDFLYLYEDEVSFGFEFQEAIDLTTNLCSWMYENDFSESKIFLVGDKEEEENKLKNELISL